MARLQPDFAEQMFLCTSLVNASTRSVSDLIVSVSSVFCRTMSRSSSVCLTARAARSSLARCRILAMLGIGERMRFIAVGLSCLSKQDERCRVGRLQAEGEIEQDERVDVEMRQAGYISGDPDGHEYGLTDQEDRRPEKTGKGLCFKSKPIIAENRSEMQMRLMKPVKMPGRFLSVGGSFSG